jgi:hypothetical protein
MEINFYPFIRQTHRILSGNTIYSVRVNVHDYVHEKVSRLMAVAHPAVDSDFEIDPDFDFDFEGFHR